MNELITTEGTLAKQTAQMIQTLVAQVQYHTNNLNALKARLLAEMEQHNITKIDTEDLLINYIAPTTRETLDYKKLKDECPEIADAYTKIQQVGASIRIKVK